MGNQSEQKVSEASFRDRTFVASTASATPFAHANSGGPALYTESFRVGFFCLMEVV